MSLVKWLAAALILLSGPLHAKEVLPVAMDRVSMAFVLDKTKARLPMGARVEFSVKTVGAAPERLRWAKGYVLGTRDGVTFIELNEHQAARLARYRDESEISIQKTKDPVKEEVAVRRDLAESGNPVMLAPLMRKLTLSMDVDAETANGWKPGEMLTFYGAQEYVRHFRVNGERKQKTEYRNMTAMFRSAVELENGKFDVTIVADPYQVTDFLRAEAEERLRAEPASSERVQPVEEERCYVTSLHGTKRREVAIPCAD